MRVSRLNFCFSLLFIVNYLLLLSNGEKTLVLAQILFRHGIRTPAGPYPNDPFKNESYWPDGWGQLTELGKLGQFELGEFVREKYKDFLRPKFSSKEVHIISSDYDRTIISAQALLSGMYKPHGKTKAKSMAEIAWGLFPVHTIPGEYDWLIQPKTYNSYVKNVYKCPRYEELFKEVFNSPEVIAHTENNLDLFNLIRNKSGSPMKRLIDGPVVTGPIHIQNLHNFSIPEWSKPIIESEEKMQIIGYGYKALTLTNELKRLGGGPLLSKFLEHIKNKVRKLEPRKMFLYSGHDMTLANVMDTLGILEAPWIDFSSALFLDLYHDDSGKYIVEIVYKNSTKTDPYVMKIPGCTDPCTVEAFSALLKPFLPVNLVEECRTLSSSATVKSFQGVGYIYGLFLSVIISQIGR